MYILLKHLCTPIADGGTEHDYSVWQFVTLFVFSSLSGRVLCHLCGVCADLAVYCWVICVGCISNFMPYCHNCFSKRVISYDC